MAEQLENDEWAGRRAIDKLLAKLATRTAGDIAQQGATPAIVIQGDVHIGGNNIICFGDCARAHKLGAELPRPPTQEPPT